MQILLTALLAIFLMVPLQAGAAELQQSPLKAPAATAQHYPKVVLYSTSWCPHCKAAKDYFTKKEIPFTNRDVEVDDEAMELLTGKYKSQGVPVIVLGEDAVILRGFDEAKFEKALQELKGKQ